MRLLTKICMPALMFGAAALATPAMAQNDASAPGNGNAAAAAPAQPAQDANSAAVPAQTAANAASASTPAAAPSGDVQTAMNTTGNAGDLSSIPDNQHKYSSAKKAAQNRSEDQTTQQLNKQEASLNGASSSGAQ
jgi:hypothetical protein